MFKASRRSSAGIVASTLWRWKSGSDETSMRVYWYTLERWIGPMFCCTPWKIATRPLFAPTK